MQQKQISGIFYAAFASLWWGVVGTIFFKFVSFASFIELTVHRTIWTAILLILTTSFYKKWPEFNQIFKKRKNQLLLCGFTFTFVYANVLFEYERLLNFRSI